MFVIIKKEKYMEKPDSSLLFRQPMYADKKQWKQFLSIFLLAAGVGFTVAGIIFFFAYNWEDLPKFAKLGIVQTLLVASVLLTVFTRWNILIKQIILTGATFLVGTLFAVFGQIYQTGADAYDLFLGWTLFTILWAFAIRFTPLWLTFIGLLCTTIWLYAMQIVPDNQWAVTLLTSAVTWICASATVVTEWMSIKGTLSRQNRWFVSLLSLATIVRTLCLAFALFNQVLSACGHPMIPLDNAQMEQFLTSVITVIAALVSWWKNNSFTKEAIEADKVYDRLVASRKRGD